MENDNLESEFQDEQVLHEHFSFTADPGQEPLRVDKYLMNRVENATRNKIQKAAKEGSVFVNDVTVKSNYKVKGGDTVRVLFGHPPPENLLVGEDLLLDIVYEDESLRNSLGENGKMFIEHEFCWEKTSEKLIELYSNL